MYYVNQIASCKLSGVKSKIITRPSLQPKAAVVLQNVFSKIAVSTRNLNKILPQTRNKFFTWGNISGTNEINNGRIILDRPSWIPILDTHQLTHTNLQQHRRVKFNEACACVRGIVPCSWLWSSLLSLLLFNTVRCYSRQRRGILRVAVMRMHPLPKAGFRRGCDRVRWMDWMRSRRNWLVLCDQRNRHRPVLAMPPLFWAMASDQLLGDSFFHFRYARSCLSGVTLSIWHLSLNNLHSLWNSFVEYHLQWYYWKSRSPPIQILIINNLAVKGSETAHRVRKE